jgi:2-(1,2-epoxy-1,2-dihydrophenyl)acetyl-CoA isomerase
MAAVRAERDGEVAVLTLDRPGALNAIDMPTLEELLAALREVERSDARALVITGAGGVFCAGADLDYVRGAFAGDLRESLTPMVVGLHAAIRQLRSSAIPVIAAIEGPAVGAGIGFALAADLRVFGRGARLVPAYLRIGASPDGGVSWLLTRALGGARTASLLLRNRAVGSEEALSHGLADAVTDDGAALAGALELASEVAGTSPRALRYLRELIDKATTNTLDQHLDLEEERIKQIWDGPDFGEGVSAFLDKRRAQFVER